MFAIFLLAASTAFAVEPTYSNPDFELQAIQQRILKEKTLPREKARGGGQYSSADPEEARQQISAILFRGEKIAKFEGKDRCGMPCTFTAMITPETNFYLFSIQSDYGSGYGVGQSKVRFCSPKAELNFPFYIPEGGSKYIEETNARNFSQSWFFHAKPRNRVECDRDGRLGDPAEKCEDRGVVNVAYERRGSNPAEGRLISATIIHRNDFAFVGAFENEPSSRCDIVRRVAPGR